MTNAIAFLPKNKKEYIYLSLHDLKKVYGDQVNIDKQFIEEYSINWTDEESTEDAMFFPGQFRILFNIARASEGNVNFAANVRKTERHTLKINNKQNSSKHDYDYSNCIKAKSIAIYQDQKMKRKSHSLMQSYNILSIKIGLNTSTLASFCHHQKSSRRTPIDKIIEWIEKEENKKSVFLIVAVVVVVIAV
ncbi:hypothetical protein C1646_767602 [Rhizophagus diaphanus]|nr:hypothetical protein C1646_767602 [Rhizophagus diaphanus] [Rhizophagus sp. MUCL 43196]